MLDDSLTLAYLKRILSYKKEKFAFVKNHELAIRENLYS